MLPVLFKPKLYAFKNRWRRRGYRRLHLSRDLVVLLFAGGLAASIYEGSVQILQRLQMLTQLAYLSPAQLISMVLTLLFVMLLLSNAATAFGTLFLGKDLDLLLAAPTSRARFFYGKLWQVAVSCSWMPLIFLAPFLAAFAALQEPAPGYYLVCLVALVPYFAIATALAAILVLLFTVLVPPHRTREVLFVAAFGALALLYHLAGRLDVRPSSLTQIGEILRIVSFLSLPAVAWSPANWAGRCIQKGLEDQAPTAFPELVLLYAGAALLLSIAYVLLAELHPYAYSRLGNLRASRRMKPEGLLARLAPLRFLVPAQQRAIFEKEFKIVSRDMTQAIQLLLLLAIAAAYLYALRVFEAAGVITDEIFGTSWKNFLFIINAAVGAFVTTAICTRFVFPSLPLEGQAYWIIQKSPLALARLLKSKFICWLLPVAFVSSVVFTAGAFAIDPSPIVALVNAASVFMISYGIVGLGIGFGAFFGDFDWEHPSQLQASFGSMIYMLFSTFLTFLSLIPTAIMMVLIKADLQRSGVLPWERLLWVAVCACFLALLNYAACRWALRLGAEALQEKLEK